jgi:hypothetical protein
LTPLSLPSSYAPLRHLNIWKLLWKKHIMQLLDYIRDSTVLWENPGLCNQTEFGSNPDHTLSVV